MKLILTTKKQKKNKKVEIGKPIILNRQMAKMMVMSINFVTVKPKYKRTSLQCQGETLKAANSIPNEHDQHPINV